MLLRAGRDVTWLLRLLTRRFLRHIRGVSKTTSIGRSCASIGTGVPISSIPSTAYPTRFSSEPASAKGSGRGPSVRSISAISAAFTSSCKWPRYAIASSKTTDHAVRRRRSPDVTPDMTSDARWRTRPWRPAPLPDARGDTFRRHAARRGHGAVRPRCAHPARPLPCPHSPSPRTTPEGCRTCVASPSDPYLTLLILKFCTKRAVLVHRDYLLQLLWAPHARACQRRLPAAPAGGACRRRNPDLPLAPDPSCAAQLRACGSKFHANPNQASPQYQ